MRFVTFYHQQRVGIGVLFHETHIIDLNAGGRELCGGAAPFAAASLREFLEQGEPALQSARDIVAAATAAISQNSMPTACAWLVPLTQARLTAPIPNPSKVVAIGQNYRDHCAEQNAPIPERPIIFAKFPTSVIGGGEAITWDPELTREVDYEAELAVVIGKKARQVAQAQAFDYVAGYMNANDVSARDLQFGDKQWVRGKSLDTFCPTGPYLVTKDEVPEPHTLAIRAILNGKVMQDSNTMNLIFNIPFLIEFVSRAFTLLPGDILLTGTPPGVGVFRKPKVLLQPGDTITIEVAGLGALTNPAAAWNV